MILGGNSTLQRYFEENKIDVDSFTSLDQKFRLKETEKYREKVGWDWSSSYWNKALIWIKLREKAEQTLAKTKNELQIFSKEEDSEYLNDWGFIYWEIAMILREELDLNGFLKKMMMKNQPKWIEISHVLSYFLLILKVKCF